MASKKEQNILIFGGLTVLGLILFTFRRKTSDKIKSMTNAEHLQQLHPKHRDKFERLIKLLERAGYNPQINSSYRTFKRQAELKKEDKRNASPGFSAHNYGLALDIQLNKNGKIYGMKTPAKDWIETGIIKSAKSYGLDWGGTFKNYYDPVHFQVEGIDTVKLYNLALKQFKTNDPNKIQGNQVNIA